MNAAIISIGQELVNGQSVDTNSAWISAALLRHGVRVEEHVTVGDDMDRLATVIRRTAGLVDLVVMTGGLGPTADDITRDALASAFGAPLEESEEALSQIRAMFERWQRPMPETKPPAGSHAERLPVHPQPARNRAGNRRDRCSRARVRPSGCPG